MGGSHQKGFVDVKTSGLLVHRSPLVLTSTNQRATQPQTQSGDWCRYQSLDLRFKWTQKIRLLGYTMILVIKKKSICIGKTINWSH